jgi:hypothetical protein
MNNPLNQTTKQAGGAGPVAVSLLTTQVTVLAGDAGNSEGKGLAPEQAMHHRANAMTEVLKNIMDRPAAPRFWGLNE